jgi:hypothetical protein
MFHLLNALIHFSFSSKVKIFVNHLDSFNNSVPACDSGLVVNLVIMLRKTCIKQRCTIVLGHAALIARSMPFCPSQTTYSGCLNLDKKFCHVVLHSLSTKAKPTTHFSFLAIK